MSSKSNIPADLKRHNKSRTALLTLGRLPVALELARALHSDGWRVLVAEPFAWHLCRLSNAVDKSFRVTAPTLDKERYLSELHQIIERQQVTLVLPVSEEILFVSELKDRLDDSVQLLCAEQSVLLSLHDKYRFMTLAQELHLPVPETVLADDLQARQRLMKGPHVLKPRLSCSGVGVVFGDGNGAGIVNGNVLGDGTGKEYGSSDVAGGVNKESGLMTDRCIVQQRLSGTACCSFSIATQGDVLTNVCYFSLLDSGSVSVCFEQMAIPEGVRSFIESVVSATAFTGMIAFDFIQDDAGVWRAIECNPRATSGLHFLEHGDVLEVILRAGKASALSSDRNSVGYLVDSKSYRLNTTQGSPIDRHYTEGSLAERSPSEGSSTDRDQTVGCSGESSPTNGSPVRRQEFWSCLMQVEGALCKGRVDKVGWRNLFTTRDITWRRSDMKPFLLMGIVLAPQLLKAFRAGRPVLELLMNDVGWHEKER